MRFSFSSSIRRLYGYLTMLLAGCSFIATAWAQQDTSDRLWQNTEQRIQQVQQQITPADNTHQESEAYQAALSALTKTPRDRLQNLLFRILEAVNQGDWFGADRLIRQYSQVPHHDPALLDFVTASRLAAEHHYSQAIAGYQSVLHTNPLFTRGLLDLGRMQYADNRLKDAQRSFGLLQDQGLPEDIQRYIYEYQTAINKRQQWQWSLAAAWVHEDNLNQASTFIDTCAFVYNGACLTNRRGEKISDSGLNFEISANKLWSFSGNHGLLFRSINYGNQYHRESTYDNLVSINTLGYQFSSARNQFQFLPSFEYDNEGGHRAYHAFGLRTSFRHQLTPRAQVEASLEYKNRHFSDRFYYLQGNYRSASLFGSYLLQPSMQLYGMLIWRDSDAQSKILAYHENIARIGVYKAFGEQLAINVAYGHRRKHADARNFVFNGRRQKDHENSIYLDITVPRLAWQGLTPSLSYEYRNNHSNIPHAYSYEKNRITLGLKKTF
ncbi:surface lipoprotein assembly modifier [Kerstersia sp.]|uniref:surface lipoprotein assembly modifier n=1 Tax=Kerstersia sp. TaxID=1930783 RepID=UPI003F8E4A97